MDLILPTNQNTSAPVTLDTKVLVVIGANGAGKSSSAETYTNATPGKAYGYPECIPSSLAAKRTRLLSTATS